MKLSNSSTLAVMIANVRIPFFACCYSTRNSATFPMQLATTTLRMAMRILCKWNGSHLVSWIWYLTNSPEISRGASRSSLRSPLCGSTWRIILRKVPPVRRCGEQTLRMACRCRRRLKKVHKKEAAIQAKFKRQMSSFIDFHVRRPTDEKFVDATFAPYKDAGAEHLAKMDEGLMLRDATSDNEL